PSAPVERARLGTPVDALDEFAFVVGVAFWVAFLVVPADSRRVEAASATRPLVVPESVRRAALPVDVTRAAATRPVAARVAPTRRPTPCPDLCRTFVAAPPVRRRSCGMTAGSGRPRRGGRTPVIGLLSVRAAPARGSPGRAAVRGSPADSPYREAGSGHLVSACRS